MNTDAVSAEFVFHFQNFVTGYMIVRTEMMNRFAILFVRLIVLAWVTVFHVRGLPTM
jgi:hypothetical protein